MPLKKSPVRLLKVDAFWKRLPGLADFRAGRWDWLDHLALGFALVILLLAVLKR